MTARVRRRRGREGLPPGPAPLAEGSAAASGAFCGGAARFAGAVSGVSEAAACSPLFAPPGALAPLGA
jgi:hypothetical protein